MNENASGGSPGDDPRAIRLQNLPPVCDVQDTDRADSTAVPVTLPPNTDLPSTVFGSEPLAPRTESGATPQQVGEYEILDVLGRGGMGIVYRAKHRQLRRQVALKMILGGVHARPEYVERFALEARAVAHLQHPHIVQIFDIGEHDGLPYFSLEFIDGGSLAQQLRKSPLPAAEAARLAEVLARAIQYAHDHGILHRDLKPANVLIARDGTAKITDFGLAKQLQEDGDSDSTRTGTIMGTPSYMSPEQARGNAKQLSPAADQYSLGAVLYEMLTGRPPFAAATAYETVLQVLREEPVRPAQMQPGLPVDIETICLKALSKEVDKRYASCAEFAEDLRRFQAGEAILARPVGGMEKAWRFCRRKPAVAGLIGAAAALLLGVITLLVVSARLTSAHALAAAQQSELQALNETAKARDVQLKATRQVADTQKYYALLGEIRQRETESRPGWTWENLRDLRDAAELDTPAVNSLEIKNRACVALGNFDLRLLGPLDESFKVSALAFSPDGKWIALAQQKHWVSNAVLVINVPEGTVRQSLSYGSSLGYQATTRRQDGSDSLAVSPDGRWLAVGTRSGMIHLWDLTAESPQPNSWQADVGATDGLAFLPDQRLVSVSERGAFHTWSLESPGKAFLTRQVGNGSDVAVHRGGQMLVAGNRVAWGQDFDRSNPLERAGGALALHPGGRLLAQGLPGGEMCLTDVASAQVIRKLVDPQLDRAHEGNVGNLSFHPGGCILASADDERLKVWQTASGRLLATVFIGPTAVGCVAFSPDGRQLAVTSDRQTVLYEVRGLDEHYTLAHQALPVTAIALNSDASTLACLCEGQHSESDGYQAEVSTWDLATDQERTHVPLPTSRESQLQPPRLAFDHSSQMLAVGSSAGDLHLIRSGADSPFTMLADDQFRGQDCTVFEEDALQLTGETTIADDALAGNRRAVRIASGQPDWPVRLLSTQLRYVEGQHQAAYVRLRLDAESTYGSGCRTALTDNGRPRLQEVRRGHELLVDQYRWFKIDRFEELPASNYFGIATMPEGPAIWVDCFVIMPFQARQQPVFSLDDSRLWGIESSSQLISWSIPDLERLSHYSNEVGGMLTGHSKLLSLAIGREHILATSFDGAIRLFTPATGELAGTMKINQPLTALALSSDEKRCAVGTLGGQLRILDVPVGNETTQVNAHREIITAVAWSSDGQWLASAGKDKQVRLWRPDPQELLPELTLPCTSVPRDIRFSIDGQQLFILLDGEYAVRVWRLDRLRQQFAELGLAASSP